MEVRLSDAEKVFIIHGAQEGLRSDGRKHLDYRPIIVETGVLSTTNGSSRVRVGSTDLLIGVKADLVVVEDMASYRNRLNFFVDCSANATPLFAGRGGEGFGTEIAAALDATYDNTYVLPDLEKLIVSPMHAWKVFVDIVILQFGGNVLDAASIGVKAALNDTEICDVIVRPGDAGKKIVDLPDDNTVWKINASRAPFVLCVNKLGGANVMDVSLTEKACVRAALWIGVSLAPRVGEASGGDEDKITFLRQCGGGALEMESVEEMIGAAIGTARELQTAFNKRLAEMANDGEMYLSTFMT